jgi:hypothetical protein
MNPTHQLLQSRVHLQWSHQCENWFQLIHQRPQAVEAQAAPPLVNQRCVSQVISQVPVHAEWCVHLQSFQSLASQPHLHLTGMEINRNGGTVCTADMSVACLLLPRNWETRMSSQHHTNLRKPCLILLHHTPMPDQKIYQSQCQTRLEEAFT